MEYSIFPTERSAKKWATEHLKPLGVFWTYTIEAVKDAGFKADGIYYAGEYWVWYKLADLKEINYGLS